MGYEDSEAKEKLSGAKPTKQVQTMTLQKAIDLGEYDPEYLSTFPEWNTLSRHIQFEYIRTALDNRNKHLLTQWAEINNMPNFRLKPHLKTALVNIEKQWKKLNKDRERFYVEYSV